MLQKHLQFVSWPWLYYLLCTAAHKVNQAICRLLGLFRRVDALVRDWAMTASLTAADIGAREILRHAG